MGNDMFEITTGSLERMKAALELLALKSKRQREENLHCFIDEEDVKEVLYVAGFDVEGLFEKKEVVPFA